MTNAPWFVHRVPDLEPSAISRRGGTTAPAAPLITVGAGG